MVIDLDSKLEAVLKERATREDIAPESLALNVLREHFLASVSPISPLDEWERRLLETATDCKATLPHSALSSEGLYE